jgi:hypothetical protein
MVDLIDIWLKLPSPEPIALDRMGVSFRVSQKVGGVRVSNVSYGRHQLDALVAGGGGKSRTTALILPVFIDPPSIWRSVDDPALIDLVAFDPTQPSRWQTLCGEGVMLGEAAYREAIFDGLELPVFRDPLRWLRSGGAGVFPLDVDHFVQEIIGHPFLVLAGQDLELSEELTSSLDASTRVDLPEVRVLV